MTSKYLITYPGGQGGQWLSNVFYTLTQEKFIVDVE